ncbi:MAG: diacylglycerol kinase family lipid kinase [Clostridiales bacterium]|nr:diacylglycerol kinase family lipid kinase [Clostridiales bacterium]
MNKRVLLIFNPVAGMSAKRPTPEKILSLFPDGYSITLKLTSKVGDGEEIARNYCNGYDIVVACGGDGTLHEVINGLIAACADIPVGYIPIGTTNDLASTLNLPAKTEDAVNLIINGETHNYDIGTFNDICFTYVASFGPGTAVSYETSKRMKNALGYGAYMLNGFLLKFGQALRDVKPRHIRIEHDGNILEDDFYFGAVSNATRIGGLFRYDENDVKVGDGLFEVMLVRRIKNPIHALPMLRRIIKRDYDGETLMYFKASDIKMYFEKEETWSVDGECVKNIKNAFIGVKKQAVRIYSGFSPLFDEG